MYILYVFHQMKHTNKQIKQIQTVVKMENIPSEFGVDLVVGGVSVLLGTGGIPTMDEALTPNSPSFPFFTAPRKMSSAQSSSMMVLNFRSKST